MEEYENYKYSYVDTRIVEGKRKKERGKENLLVWTEREREREEWYGERDRACAVKEMSRNR